MHKPSIQAPTTPSPQRTCWHSPSPDRARARVLELLRRYGTCATSFQALEQGSSFWFDGSMLTAEAAIAYVDAGGHRVAVGAPICAPDQIAAVAARFVDASRGRRVLFFGVEAGFMDALVVDGVRHDALKVAEQPEWCPARYTTAGRLRRTVRAQVNRAQNKGVRVRAVAPEEIASSAGTLRAKIEQVLEAWLSTRRMGVMRFMVDLEPFTFPEERRYYVAERGEQPVGFLAAVPVYGRRGWFFEDVIRVPDAPNGTTETLVHAAMEDARRRGDAFVTLGMAPLAGVTPGPGRHRMLRLGLSHCYDRLGPLYQFAGVRAFKARFKPDVWTPLYVVACPGPVTVWSFYGLLAAFADGVLPFTAETIRRLSRRVLSRK